MLCAWDLPGMSMNIRAIGSEPRQKQKWVGCVLGAQTLQVPL